jgi:formylglycine-generating enzyme required for sulfatase activity
MSIESIGPYRLLEELGRGAMGVVFRGFDPAIDRHVAIKIIQTSQFASPEERSELKLRFAREGSAAGKLSHPNIVTIHQLGEEGDLQYLVLELVNGCSLEKTLAGGKPQDPETAVSIIAQVADALDYAHREGIVHRDVKPANILIRPDGTAKITDFGIARIASQTVTRTGSTFGTPAYMSPEQIETANVGGEADQYSLGVIAYQLLSGRKPFDGTGPTLMFQIMSEEAPPLHTVNEALSPRTSEVIRKVLAKRPEDRFGSCLEFAERLSASLRAETGAGDRPPRTAAAKPASGIRGATKPPSGIRAPSPSGIRAPLAERALSPEPAGAPKGGSRLGLWIALGLAVVVAGGAAWVWWPRATEPTTARAFPLGDTNPAAKDGKTAAPGPEKPGSLRTKVNAKDGLTYVWIPPGTFQMGCSPGDGECYDDERPVHEVKISNGFWMGQTEVTQAAWEHVMGNNPSRVKRLDLPIQAIGWNDARTYCQTAGMRLPTEAEWEYAARAANTASRYGNIGDIAWYGGNSGDSPHEVGGKPANAWGLYDTLGNVWEWVADWADDYTASSATDPQGPATGASRVLRGGAWGVNPQNARVSMRFEVSPTNHDFDQYFGVRCAGN